MKAKPTKRRSSVIPPRPRTWSKRLSRPFNDELKSATLSPEGGLSGAPVNQAQLDRIARTGPNVTDTPLHPPQIPAMTQAKEEENLQPPQGTLQRQAAEREEKEALQLQSEKEEIQKAEDEEKAIQAQLEEEEEIEEEEAEIQAKSEEVEKKKTDVDNQVS
ncbi:hypothetical protein [Baaleninema sp.]|uniref:hypothetical protein n=1 Tax=Baaleninema sp. TaxID=3101197 RepID=UPI003D03CFE1